MNLPSIVDQVYKIHGGKQAELEFSLCFSNSDGGYMSIGGYNSDLHKKGSKTNIISYDAENSLYTVDIK